MHKPGLFWMNGVLLVLLNFFTMVVRAQQPAYLILIDAENKQAFTVRVGDQLYASSGHGHLVLSRLKDSSYKLNVRFPKNSLPEQVFPIAVRQKDLGFELKGSDSTWSLFNWQTRETIRPVYMPDSSRMLEKGIKRDDGFSRLMAAVVNDSSVMYNTYSGSGFGAGSGSVAIQKPRPLPALPANTANPSTTDSTTKNPAVVSTVPAAVAVTGKKKPAAAPKKGKQPVAGPVDSASVVSKAPVIAAVIPEPVVTEKPVAANVPVKETADPAIAKLSMRDSLQADKKLKDSISRVYKAAVKDSLQMVKKLNYSKDSLAKVVKAAYKDSLQTAKKLYRDSLKLAKADRLSPETQQSAARASQLQAQKAAATRDSLLLVQQEAAVRDSIYVIQKDIFLKDSMLAVEKCFTLSYYISWIQTAN